jgi:hypothetical protein
MTVQQAFESPRNNPLTFPGPRPEKSVLVTESHEWVIEPSDKPLTALTLQSAPRGDLGKVLFDLGATPMSERIPLLAIGANACPAQLRHKSQILRFPLHVPMLRARVRGLSVAHAAFMSHFGYVPATVTADPESSADAFMLMLDEHQLYGLDMTQTEYRRVLITSRDGFDIDVDGIPLPAAYVYVAGSGPLRNPDDRQPVALHSQPALMERLVNSSSSLRAIMGDSPEQIVERGRRTGPIWHAALVQALRDAGWSDGADRFAMRECHKEHGSKRLGELDGDAPRLLHANRLLAKRQEAIGRIITEAIGRIITNEKPAKMW